jgi:hypothetical protein
LIGRRPTRMYRTAPSPRSRSRKSIGTGRSKRASKSTAAARCSGAVAAPTAVASSMRR